MSRSIRARLFFIVGAMVWAIVVQAANDFKTHRYNRENGLPNNYITTIVQDPQGFLWYSSSNGLCRFDGYSFENLQLDNLADEKLRRSNRIRTLYMNPNGLLWLRLRGDQYACYDTWKRHFVDFTGASGNAFYRDCCILPNGDTWLHYKRTGALLVEYNNGKLTRHEYSEANHQLTSNLVTFIVQDSHQHTWIGTDRALYLKVKGQSGLTLVDNKHVFSFGYYVRGRLYLFDTAGNIFQLTAAKKIPVMVYSAFTGKEAPKNVCALIPWRGDTFLIVTKTTTYEYSPKQHSVWKSALQMPALGVERTEKGYVYVSDSNGFFWRLQENTGVEQHFEVFPQMFNKRTDVPSFTAIHDDNGNIWVCTNGNGLFCYDTTTASLHHYLMESAQSPIASNNLFFMAKDWSGNLWLAEENMGVTCLTILPKGFHHVYPRSSEQLGYGNTVNLLRQVQPNRVLVGNKDNELFQLSLPALSLQKLENWTGSDVISACTDRSGTLWLGTRQGVLIGDKFYQHERNNEQSLKGNRVTDIRLDSKGRVWLTSVSGGLNLAVKNADGSYRFRHFIDKTPNQREMNVLISTRKGWMAAGYYGGVCLYKPDELATDTSRYVLYDQQNGGIGNYEVSDIMEDANGHLWVATMGGGVYVSKGTDYRHLTFQRFTTQQGLTSDLTRSLVADQQQHIWVGTDYGLSRYDKLTKTFSSYFPSGKEWGNAFTGKTALLLNNGQLAFGTNNGIVAFHPDSVSCCGGGDLRATPVITEITINGSPLHEVVSDWDFSKRRLTLKHNQNSITFSFSNFSYDYPRRTEYSYRLRGYDDEWSALSTANAAIYKSLAPGTYTFEVKTADGNSSMASLEIKIHQPWWNTWWAWLIYLTAVGVVGFHLANNLRTILQLRQRIKVEKQLAEFKQRFFMNVSHEFRTPLTLIRGTVEKLNSRKKLPNDIKTAVDDMARNTDRLLRLVNQLLEYNRMKSGKLKLSVHDTDIIAFVNKLAHSFYDMANSRNMTFRVETFADTHHVLADTDMVDKMLFNLLSNAFKYTPDGGTVLLSVLRNEANKTLQFSVTDNGVGIPKEKQKELFSRFMHTEFSTNSMGIGLNLTKELAERHHGSIRFNENAGGGSIFTVTLPDTADVYSPDEIAKTTDEPQTLAATIPASSMSQEEELVPLSDKQVLIIEDDLEVCKLLQREMSPYFQLTVRHNGAEGLKYAQENDVDLVVCDVMMPVMDGYEVVNRLKTKFDTCHIPIILLTALDTEESHFKGINLGADSYVTKPFSVRLLVARVIQLIKQRDKTRERFVTDTKKKTLPLVTNEQDKQFMNNFNALFAREIMNSDFSIDDYARELAVGRTIFFRKVKGITGFTPNEYIRVMRLKAAAEKILNTRQSISEIAYSVGFNDPLYFSRCFKKQFGVPPKEYGIKGTATNNAPATD